MSDEATGRIGPQARLGSRHARHSAPAATISGFDDIPVAAVSVPALTTVRMPTEAMIVAALDLAIGPALAGADSHPVLQPELVVRASTGPVPSQPAEGA